MSLASIDPVSRIGHDPTGGAVPPPRRRGRAFGVDLACQKPLRMPLASPLGAGEALILQASDGPLAVDTSAMRQAFASRQRRSDGGPRFEVFRSRDRDLLRFHGWADHLLSPGRVDSFPDESNPQAASMLELHWLGMVMAYLQELQGRPVLHASVVEVDGLAVAFAAGNSGGKTALAASLVEAGQGLISDDLLVPVRRPGGYAALPAYPSMRMWPQLAAHFAGPVAALAPVHDGTDKRLVPVGPDGFGRFELEARGLACIYLPERVAAEADTFAAPVIEALGPSDALVALVATSFLPWAGTALESSGKRMAELARLLGKVPLRRLRYVEGVEGLPLVRQSILDDLGRTLTPSAAL